MRVLSIGLGIFILTSSVWAGTFVETFDDNRNLEKWQELIRFGLDSPGPWNIVDGELQYIQDLRKLSKYRIYGHKKVVFPYF